MSEQVIGLLDLRIHQVADLQAEADGLQYIQRAEHRRMCRSCLDSTTSSGSGFVERQRALRRTGENRMGGPEVSRWVRVLRLGREGRSVGNDDLDTYTHVEEGKEKRWREIY